MPAFLAKVESDEGYVGDVYFVKHAVNARRSVCDEHQDGEFSGAIVTRMPHFDKYEAQGWVPMRDMAYEGWWSECTGCHIKLCEDEQYDDDDNEFILDIDKFVGPFGGGSFCTQECSDDFHKRKKIENSMKAELENMMKAKIESKYGVVGIVYPDQDWPKSFWTNVVWGKGGGPYVSKAQLNFLVPGCNHGGCTYVLEDPDGTGKPVYTMSYARGDEDVVLAFIKERTGISLDKHDSRS